MAEPTIRSIHETVLYASDLARARWFYVELLGLEPIDSGLDGLGFAMRIASGSVLLIFDPAQSQLPGRPVPSHGALGPGHIAFAITREAYPDWISKLQSHSIEIEQEVLWPNGAKSIYVRDPAGNSVELEAGDLWRKTDAEK